MSLSVPQLIASAEVCAEARRLRRVASDLTQADIVERCEGTTVLDQFVRIECGKWPLLSKPCTAIAKAMALTAEGEAQLLLLACRASPRRGWRRWIPWGRCGHRLRRGERTLSPTMDSARGLHLFTTNPA